MFRSRFKLKVLAAAIMPLMLLAGCAYRFGSGERALPGGYDLVAVPVFANKTMETGVEVYFTNALIEEFEKSRVARIMPKNEAQVTVLGTVNSVTYAPSGTITDQVNPYLPDKAILTSSYRIVVTATIKLVRNSDRKILWTGDFENERSYLAPLVTLEKLNTVDPLYNDSARDTNIARIAKDMMFEAHNRITETF